MASNSEIPITPEEMSDYPGREFVQTGQPTWPMTDTEILEWIDKHPGKLQWGKTEHGRPCWEWSADGRTFWPAFTIRSAVMAAAAASGE